MATSSSSMLVFSGSSFFRQRMILSCLSGKPVKIKNIRHKDEDPGIREFEVNFLKLLQKISNGCKIDINETGTNIYFVPGLLFGGKMEHECSLQKSIGYYLEALACFAPFCKNPLDITLHGITNDSTDPSVDAFKVSTLPVMKRFLGTDEGLELKIVSRGMPPEGGGQIIFQCPVRRQLRPIQLTSAGKIKRIRGVAFAVRVSPAMANRLVEKAKGILLNFLPDIYIYTDSYKGKHSGKSPGFGLCLVAETTEGVFMSAEAMSNPSGSNKGPSVPEDVAEEAAHALLDEIFRGGCVDSRNQSLSCLFMALGPPDVSKLQVGPLSPFTIQFLRHLKDFFQIMFKLETQKAESEESLQLGARKILLSCLGTGFTNISKITR